MIDEDTYCIDILTQVSAVTKTLQSVAVGLLDQHVRHCVSNAAAGRPRSRQPNGHRGNQSHRASDQIVTLRCGWRHGAFTTQFAEPQIEYARLGASEPSTTDSGASDDHLAERGIKRLTRRLPTSMTAGLCVVASLR